MSKEFDHLYRKQAEQGRVYVLYPVKEIMEEMNRSEVSVSKYLSELEDAKLLENGWMDEDGKTHIHYSVADFI